VVVVEYGQNVQILTEKLFGLIFGVQNDVNSQKCCLNIILAPLEPITDLIFF
jgi:hypothetical protein